MIKIYFGCSMRGGHSIISREELSQFPNIIEGLGYELTSKHQTKAGIIQEEDEQTTTSVHERDYEFLMKADLGIFEISNPSLGVGSEISDMGFMVKPVLCLFKKGLGSNISAYIRGRQGSKYVNSVFEFYPYESLEDAKEKIRQFVEANS